MPRGIPNNQEKKHRRRRRRRMEQPQQQLQQEQAPIEVSHEQFSPVIDRLLGRIAEGPSPDAKFAILRENIESLSKWLQSWPSGSTLRVHAEAELIEHLHALRTLREAIFGAAPPIAVAVPAPAPETQPTAVC